MLPKRWCRKSLGSLTSNARLFDSVSRGSDLSGMPPFFARFAISSTLPGVEIDKRTPCCHSSAG